MKIKTWTQECLASEIILTPIKKAPSGWYEIRIENEIDLPFSTNPYLMLHLQNPGYSKPIAIPMKLIGHELRVTFIATESIAQLRMTVTPMEKRTPCLKINIKRCNASRALWSIMSHISQRDKKLGIDSNRIYRKSYARFRKHGYAGFLQRLLKEYHLSGINSICQEELYQTWIEHYESPIKEKREHRLSKLKAHPRISIIMATWKSDLRWLKAAISSVQVQSYPHWELCIADDGSRMPALTHYLKQIQANDPRVRIVLRNENGHISAAQNSALELARGEYITFLDHDDLLDQDALLHIAEALQTTPRPRFLYSDEDKLDGLGRRNNPHFKSGWNPDLLYSQNYITHLMIIEHELIKEIGGFRIGLEGSQDHDLALRATEHLPASAIHHIPHILYHWRITENSTALHADAKSYTEDASMRALREHIQRTGKIGVRVKRGELPNTYRLQYPIPKPEPLVSLIIPTRNKLELLRPCINSILKKTTYNNYEIIIIDNGSTDKETLTYLTQLQNQDPRIRVLKYNHIFNYSSINNYGVKQAQGTIIGLLNNDVEVITPEWLTEMVSHAVRNEIGCVGAKLFYTDHTIQHGGVILGIGGVAGHSHKYSSGDANGYFSRLKLIQNLSAVTGACMVLRKTIYDEVAGLDEENLTIAFNDVDLCLRVREKGYRNLWTPYAELFHHESKSRGSENTQEKISRFNAEVEFMKKTWGEKLLTDPYYNENLTLVHEDFTIKNRCT